MIQQVALVSDTALLSLADLASVAAAIQKQVLRDFAPIWNIQASVSAFARLDDVPVGYWRVIVADDIDGLRIGFHRTQQGDPYAMVLFREDWATTASHEILEMLVDPSGDRVVAGDSPDPNQGRVEFLLEVCDPCADPDQGYDVNGIRLCDFCTPNYFDPVASTGVRYSFTGRIGGPREINVGGYLSWRLPGTDQWFVASRNGGLQIDQSPAPVTGGSLREYVDRYTRTADKTKRLKSIDKRANNVKAKMMMAAQRDRAVQLREEIERIGKTK